MIILSIDTDLVVKPNWIAHVNSVLRRCGVLHSNFVCDQISLINIFISFGFRMLSARTDLLVRLDMVLMLSRSLKLLICQTNNKWYSDYYLYRHCESITWFKPTGYSERSLPVFCSYMSLKMSNASSVSPHSIKNLGLSGKKNSHKPSIKLKKERKSLVRMRCDGEELKFRWHLTHTPWYGADGHKQIPTMK